MEAPASNIPIMISSNITLNEDEKTYSYTIIYSTKDCRILQVNFPNVQNKDIIFLTYFNYWEEINLKINLENITDTLIERGYIAPLYGVYWTLTDITDYHEMTLWEIEKELGYKIKIKNK